jgi:hypothetical protein
MTSSIEHPRTTICATVIVLHTVKVAKLEGEVSTAGCYLKWCLGERRIPCILFGHPCRQVIPVEWFLNQASDKHVNNILSNRAHRATNVTQYYTYA